MSFPVQRHFGLVLLFNLLTLGVYHWVYIHRMFKAADERRGVQFLAPLFWTAVGVTVLMLMVAFLSLPTAAAQEATPIEGQPVERPPWLERTAQPTTLMTLLVVASALLLAAFYLLELARFHPRVVSPLALPGVLMAGMVLELMAMSGAFLIWAQLALAFFGLMAAYELHWKMRDWFDEPLPIESDDEAPPAYAGTA